MPARFDRLFTALAVLAGLLIGFAASSLAYRYRWMRVPSRGLIQRMDQVLKLTPEQHDQIAQVLDETRSKMEDLRRESERQRRAVLSETSDKIHALLSADQQKDLDRYFLPGMNRRAMGTSGFAERGGMGQGPPPPPP